MCELFALSASEPVDVKLSLAELARHGGETGIHADGWGVAFLEGRDAHVFREPSAAARSPWIECLQTHAVRSSTVVAQIRHATQGAISLANTQPFVRELCGQIHVFVHNGHLGALPREASSPRACFRPIGETDSERAFCILLEILSSQVTPGADHEAGLMLEAFTVFTREMRQRGPANIIHASNGRLLVHADRRTQRPCVIEPPGLWMLERTCKVPPPVPESHAGVSLAGSATHVLLLASVPLSNEAWQPLAQGSVLLVESGRVRTA